MKDQICKITLAPDAAIIDAAHLIQNQDIKIALVCDENGKLLGTVTDGDIRRAIIEKTDLDGPISAIMNASPKVATEEEGGEQIKERMRKSVLRYMPILDEEHRVVDLIALDEPEKPSLPNAVVLIAGGKGMRLRPFTENLPKPLLKIGSKTVIERSIETFRRQGFRKFYVAVHYLAEMMKDHLGDGSKWGVQIEYLDEEKPLGTGGVLRTLREQSFPFVVINGDIITDANFRSMVDLCVGDTLSVLGVREYSYQIPFGCVTLSNHRVVDIEEKPTHHYYINAGVYVLSPEVLKHLPSEEAFTMPELFQNLIEMEKRIRHFPITGEWMDIGSKEDLEWARTVYSDRDSDD